MARGNLQAQARMCIYAPCSHCCRLPVRVHLPENHGKSPMSDPTAATTIQQALAERFDEKLEVDASLPGLAALAHIVGHRSHRRFLPQPVEPDLLRLLCACALSAPSKSDLQQCDIIIVSDATIRKSIVSSIPDMPWINDAPVFLVFAANGRRLPAISKLRGKPFPNDHLDLFFNAAVDAAIA